MSEKIQAKNPAVQKPLVILLLGLCPAVAMTGSVMAALGVAGAALAIILLSNLTLWALRRVIPAGVRLPAALIVTAFFTTAAQMTMNAWLPDIYQLLGVYLAAIFAVLGHLYPLYFGFKGGKGVLVAGGTILAIQPVLIPFLAVIFLACLLPTGMVSLGSVTMAALYPVLTILYGVFRGYSAADLTVCAIGSVIMGAMVIYMHRSNIQRIREGKEYRFGRHGKK